MAPPRATSHGRKVGAPAAASLAAHDGPSPAVIGFIFSIRSRSVPTRRPASPRPSPLYICNLLVEGARPPDPRARRAQFIHKRLKPLLPVLLYLVAVALVARRVVAV